MKTLLLFIILQSGVNTSPHHSGMANLLQAAIPMLSHKGNMSKNWEIFKQMHSNYCILNDIQNNDEKKCASMMIGIGEEGLKAYEALDKPPADRYVWKKLLKHLDSMYEKKGNLIFDTFLFNRCDQKDQQSYKDYFLEVQELAKVCEFKGLKDRMIRDRIVAGIKNNEHREKALLVNEEAATLEKLQTYLLGLENASKMGQGIGKVKNYCPKDEDINADIYKVSMHRNQENKDAKEPCPKCGNFHPMDYQDCDKWHRPIDRFENQNRRRFEHRNQRSGYWKTRYNSDQGRGYREENGSSYPNHRRQFQVKINEDNEAPERSLNDIDAIDEDRIPE